MKREDLWKLVLVIAFLLILVGFGGMALSFIYLASASLADITAGTSGFVAGAVLTGSGLIACSVIAGSRSHGFDGAESSGT